jgi:glycosyltransferase involved in cell wall biosynthesis
MITPTLNRVNYLRECIESVVKQSHDDVEHVVVDGSSTDGSVELLQSMSARYGDRIRWISQPDNGICQAVNRGFQMATGDVTGWIGSDDRLAEGALVTVARYFHENPSAQWLYGSYVILDSRGNFLQMKKAKPYNYKRFLRTCYICGPSVFVRTELAHRVSPVCEDLKYMADFEWYLRLAAAAEPHKLDPLLAYLRWYPGCLSFDRRLDQLDERLRISLNYVCGTSERARLTAAIKSRKLRARFGLYPARLNVRWHLNSFLAHSWAAARIWLLLSNGQPKRTE